MYIEPDLLARIEKLDEAVSTAGVVPDDSFRTALCDLIREVPANWGSEARELCLDENCPYGATVIEHLQHDLDAHIDDLEYTRIFHPLMRLAVSIRTAELRYSIH